MREQVRTNRTLETAGGEIIKRGAVCEILGGTIAFTTPHAGITIREIATGIILRCVHPREIEVITVEERVRKFAYRCAAAQP